MRKILLLPLLFVSGFNVQASEIAWSKEVADEISWSRLTFAGTLIVASETQLAHIDAAGNLLWLYGSRGRLRNGLRQAARRCGLPVVSLPMLFGMLADHVPFVRSGREAITMTLVSPMLRFLHTERDDSAAFSLESFKGVSRLLERWFASDDVA